MTIPIPTVIPFEKNILPDIVKLYTGTNLGLTAWSLQLEHNIMFGHTKRFTTEEACAQAAREAHIITEIISKDRTLKLNITLDYE